MPGIGEIFGLKHASWHTAGDRNVTGVNYLLFDSIQLLMVANNRAVQAGVGDISDKDCAYQLVAIG
ncbi:MAG: hypothetical protein KKD01_15320 [Proteobacteria bacterium]|nr:hypothetical protein [Pseudomonadota bacterium]MBU1420530.1 hypothetical protein [Pseudomonadota bacterium]MBU1456093.1 hypothetical protein [Pseudomonadota bacterium]